MSLLRFSHLQQAHLTWNHWLQEGDWAIDATCGNGHDTLKLRETTLASLKSALSLVSPGGLVSLTLYPGHPEGAAERTFLLDYVATLDPGEFIVSHTSWENRNAAPSLLIIQKNTLR